MTDMKQSKIGETSKFMKDPTERQNVYDIIYQNIEKLLDNWIYIIGSNNESYPIINYQLFVDSLKTLGIYSENDKTLLSEDL